MKVQFDIYPDGRVVTEVLERQNDNCDNVHQLTQGLGHTESDEKTGPDCNEVHEGSFNT